MVHRSSLVHTLSNISETPDSLVGFLVNLNIFIFDWVPITHSRWERIKFVKMVYFKTTHQEGKTEYRLFEFFFKLFVYYLNLVTTFF